jgi:hypothetical protein
MRCVKHSHIFILIAITASEKRLGGITVVPLLERLHIWLCRQLKTKKNFNIFCCFLLFSLVLKLHFSFTRCGYEIKKSIKFSFILAPNYIDFLVCTVRCFRKTSFSSYSRLFLSEKFDTANAQPLHILPKYDNWNICRKFFNFQE